MAQKPAPRVSNSGRADFAELERQQRISHSSTRGYDAEPNPSKVNPDGSVSQRGHVLSTDGVWRKGLSPEKYHALTVRYEELVARGRETDDFRPELTPEEEDAYKAYVKALTPEKKEKKA